MENEDRLIFTVVIAGRKQKDAILTAMLTAGVHVIHTLYGHGTVKTGYLENTLGLIPEHKKVVITALSKRGKSQAILKILHEEFHFNIPNTGIVFTIPVEKISF